MKVSIFSDIYIKPNSFKAWLLAARPKTLTAASVPVMIGCAYAWNLLERNVYCMGEGISDLNLVDPSFSYGVLQNGFNWIAAALCFLFAFIMQIDANFVNDYFDCVKGKDNEERLGPERACQQGWVTLTAMRWAIAITSVLACLVGLPLVLYGGIELIAIGAACLLFCFLYTTCLASIAMGDILVLLFFGIVPVVFTSYVIVPFEMQQWQEMPWLLGVATGLVVDTLLLINNYRDIETDRHVGKKTLVVFIGRERTEWLYCSIVPVALLIILLQFGFSNLNIILLFGIYFFHIGTWNMMRRIGKGRELNKVLGKTARNIFIYGILTTILVILQ